MVLPLVSLSEKHGEVFVDFQEKFIHPLYTGKRTIICLQERHGVLHSMVWTARLKTQHVLYMGQTCYWSNKRWKAKVDPYVKITQKVAQITIALTCNSAFGVCKPSSHRR